MSDLVVEKREQESGMRWRLKQADDGPRFGLGQDITFELADADGAILASFKIPTDSIAELLQPLLSTFAELQLDGGVVVDAELTSGFQQPLKKLDVLQMVSEALAPQMLEDEPNAEEQLQTLRLRLVEALAIVDRTLSSFNKATD